MIILHFDLQPQFKYISYILHIILYFVEQDYYWAMCLWNRYLDGNWSTSSKELTEDVLISSSCWKFERKTDHQQSRVLKVNLVLSTGLIMWTGHRKEIWKLTFQELALCRGQSRNCGLCVVYIQKYGAMLLVGVRQREKQQNKLVEFADTVWIKSADLKNIIFLF